MGQPDCDGKMLRPSMVSIANHTAIPKFLMYDKQIILAQKFAEGEYFCRLAAGITIVGRDAALARGEP